MVASNIDGKNEAILLAAAASGASEGDLQVMQQIAHEGIPIGPLFDDPFEELHNPGVALPHEVTDKISYTAWTGLSRVICEGWLQNQKWLMSETIGYDIGTPLTVGLMVERNPTNSRGVTYVVRNRVKHNEIADFIRLTAMGYLLRTNFDVQLPPLQDEHGQDQLEGELRRYWARKHDTASPSDVTVTSLVIDDYCITYGLNGASQRFAERLNL